MGEGKREGRKAKPKAKGRRAQGEKQKAKARYTHTGWTIVILKKNTNISILAEIEK